MNESEREEFLQAFEQENDGTLVAFCVMGGIFGEGIDLKNDRLIGAIIVGTGLPQISNEREILKQFYDKQGLSDLIMRSGIRASTRCCRQRGA